MGDISERARNYDKWDLWKPSSFKSCF